MAPYTAARSALPGATLPNASTRRAGRGRAPAAAATPAQRDTPACVRKPNALPRALTAVGARVPAHRQSLRVLASAGSNGASSGDDDVENVVIIGSGPAGYTASIYAGRANLRPLCFEGLSAGGVRGGQLMTTTEVENFPGFPEGITGPDLMERMRAQAERWGAVLETEDVESVDLSVRPFVIKSTERTVRAHTVIVATGATAKRLNIPSEERFWSNGISACAICDGASPIFKGEELAVVGGGDTATEEALYLTKYAKHVHLLVRGAEMRASKTMQDRVNRHENVTVHLSTSVVDAVGDPKTGRMTHLRVKNEETNQESDLGVRGLFYGIGHKPNSSILGGQVELDAAGYVVVKDGVHTSVEGVFAAGDLHDTEWRQAITAAGSGCMSAIATERYLAERGLATIHVPEEKNEAEAAKEEQEQKKKAAAAGTDEEKSFDVSETMHTGQFALRKLYHESDRPIIVLYTSPTCGPCRTLKPIWKSLATEYDGKIHYVAIDIEQDPEIAEAAGVNGTPTIHLFYNKERLHNLPGVKMKSDYRKLIDPLLEADVASASAKVEVEVNA